MKSKLIGFLKAKYKDNKDIIFLDGNISVKINYLMDWKGDKNELYNL